MTSVIANCFSYVAALTERSDRTLRVSVVEGMQLVAAMAGPFLSKLMKHHLGTRAVFIGRPRVGTDFHGKETVPWYFVFSEWSLLCSSVCLLSLLEGTHRTSWERETITGQTILSSSSYKLHKDNIRHKGKLGQICPPDNPQCSVRCAECDLWRVGHPLHLSHKHQECAGLWLFVRLQEPRWCSWSPSPSPSA